MSRRRPTFSNNDELFQLFFLAETIHKTVDELLLGEPKPLSHAESVYWTAYFWHKKQIEDAASKKSAKNSAVQQQPGFKKTMAK